MAGDTGNKHANHQCNSKNDIEPTVEDQKTAANSWQVLTSLWKYGVLSRCVSPRYVNIVNSPCSLRSMKAAGNGAGVAS